MTARPTRFRSCEAGLPARAPGTWEEIREWSRRLTRVQCGETRQNASWEFMEYVTNPDSVSYIVRTTGYTPISPAALNHPETVAYFKQYPERKVAVEQLQYTRPQASVISLGTGTEILRQMVEKTLVGGFPVRQIMRETAADLRKGYEETF